MKGRREEGDKNEKSLKWKKSEIDAREFTLFTELSIEPDGPAPIKCVGKK